LRKWAEDLSFSELLAIDKYTQSEVARIRQLIYELAGDEKERDRSKIKKVKTKREK